MSRVLLDTTYLLPVAGIQVQGVQRDTIKRAGALGHQLFISEVSFFELAAKGAKLVRDGAADRDRIADAVQSLVSDDGFTKVNAYEEEPLSLAIDLRQHHSDFVDCLILASAVCACEILVTEDESLAGNVGLTDLIRETKPGFSITTSKRLLGDRPA